MVRVHHASMQQRFLFCARHVMVSVSPIVRSWSTGALILLLLFLRPKRCFVFPEREEKDLFLPTLLEDSNNSMIQNWSIHH
mmetsp:Transcript_6351/g.12999  ORF Transcript_6351/g.12999 Transcript_6351/m.12999 type:complete len:81 (-) Transcript_6351:92-334(-)